MYTNWWNGEPNDFAQDERYLHYSPTVFGGGTGGWNDQDAEDVSFFDEDGNEVVGVGGYVVEYECPTKATGGGASTSEEGESGNVGFNARKGADAVATGQIEVHFWGGTKVHTEVTCLSVWGDDAWIGSVTTRSDNDDFPVGTQYFWRITDNGQGNNADADREGYFFYSTNPNTQIANRCALQLTEDVWPSYEALFELQNGNYKVH
ncbi:MAG: hypothetical protein HKN13_12150 [Rhodothermales bacterium]|nr:hypothetical protein [Rhodothermales bacterium]